MSGARKSSALAAFALVSASLAASAPLLGCAPDDDPTLFDDSLAELPQTLDEVGLFQRSGNFDDVPDGVVDYIPAWQLWSNGSVKKRHVFVPPGKKVERKGDTLEFPTGSLLFKTFLYPDPDSDDMVPVETRLLRLGADERWEYAVYLWDEDAKSATLADITLGIEAKRPDGGVHTIPALLDCRSCHESASTFALGWDDVQLADAADALVEEGVLAAGSVQAAPIPADDDLTRDVLGSLYGNCAHCHNGSDGPSSAFDLRPGAALGNMVDVETESSATAAGIRVVPGDPMSSILFLAWSGETEDPEVKDMPPAGVDDRDTDGINQMRTWIENLD